MKKYLHLIVGVLFITFIIPSIALASWWNPFSWFNNWGHSNQPDKTEILEKKVQELEAKLASTTDSKATAADTSKKVPTVVKSIDNSTLIKVAVDAQVKATLEAKQNQDVLVSKQDTDNQIQSSTTIIATNTAPVTYSIKRTFKTDGDIDLGDYNGLALFDYMKNPKASFNKPVKIIGGVVSLFDQRDTNNYVVIGNGNAKDFAIWVAVVDDNTYTTLTNNLAIGDRVIIYGYGASTQNYGPVIDLDAIYKCGFVSPCRDVYDVGISKIYNKSK